MGGALTYCLWRSDILSSKQQEHISGLSMGVAKEAATLPHLFTFENFFELPLDPLDRDVGHGCVCSDAASPRTPGASLCLPGASVDVVRK